MRTPSVHRMRKPQKQIQRGGARDLEEDVGQHPTGRCKWTKKSEGNLHLSQRPDNHFAPQNSIMKTAIARTDQLIDKLIKKKGLEEFEAEIEKKIAIGCLEEVPAAELEQLLKRTHHFCYLATVVSANLESTPPG